MGHKRIGCATCLREGHRPHTRAAPTSEMCPEGLVANRARGHRYNESDAGRASRRRSQLRKLYGITVEDYDEMLERQGGVCAVCGELPNDRTLHVDHDHEGGRVRGLLCFACNVKLAHIEDTAFREAAMAYLAWGSSA